MLALFLLVPNLLSVLALVCMLACIEIQVRRVEEPHLRRAHGAAYESYAARVGRFLPRIGRVRVRLPTARTTAL